ncbi:MAG: pirin family protein [Candidatus Cybelea sp.]
MPDISVHSPTFEVVRSSDRGHAALDWLDTYYSFSFADYYDPKNLNWGALRVFNDDRIAPGAGFPPHPHRDMEIVTYVLSGELAHRDSMGNEGVVGPGGVQFMSAGTGVRHSEYNNSRRDPLHLVQMWVLPGQVGTTPSYGQMAFDENERRDRWLTVVSGEPATPSPIRITQTATLRVARAEGVTISVDLAPKRYGYLFVAQGSAQANGEALETGDSVRLYDVARLDVGGNAEFVLWDLPGAD